MSETKSVERSPRKEKIGQVLSNKMTKTIVVRVERRFSHPRFRKVVTRFRKFYVHDEKQEAQAGDHVRIEETRPLSRTKRWRLVEILRRNTDAAAPSAT
jgi:small subunit ribosomal protein S17